MAVEGIAANGAAAQEAPVDGAKVAAASCARYRHDGGGGVVAVVDGAATSAIVSARFAEAVGCEGG